MVVARSWGDGRGELWLNGDRVSVLQVKHRIGNKGLFLHPTAAMRHPYHELSLGTPRTYILPEPQASSYPLGSIQQG